MYIVELFHGGPEQPTEKQADLVETSQTQLVVLYPGRFQPFHLGHADVFRTLQAKFGRDNVFIATSNKTDGKKSPFNFTDKTAIMHAAGVPNDRILEVQSPYKLPAQFDPTTTVFVVAVGAPDVDRLQPDAVKKDGNPGYYKTFKSLDQCVTADKHGYVVIAAERHQVITLNGQQVDVSHGTPSRAAWNSVRKDPKGRAEYMNQMFGRADQELGLILDKIPESVGESFDGNLLHRRGLTFQQLDQLSESARANYSQFDKLVSQKLKLNKWESTLELYGIYRKQFNESKHSKKLTESAMNSIEKNLYRKFTERSHNALDTVSVGDSASILWLSTITIPGDEKVIAKLHGFLSPKKVARITGTGQEKYITFDDGSKFPETDPQGTFKAQSWHMSKLFPDYDSASQTLMFFDIENERPSNSLEFAINVDTSRDTGTKESIDMQRRVPLTKIQPIHPEEMDRLVTSIGQKAKQGPMKTVWNPLTRKYKVVPAAQASLEEDDVAPMSREEYNSRRRALQQIQMDPELTRDPTLRKELIKKIARLTMQARATGVLPESVHAAHVQENKMYTARAIVETIKYLKESLK